MTMAVESMKEWFGELSEQVRSLRLADGNPDAFHYEYDQANEWIGLAETAITSVLPTGHPLLRQWHEILKDPDETWGGTSTTESISRLTGVFNAAYRLIRENRLGTIVDGIRAETVSDVLDQAEELVSAKHSVAGTVLAGGALETHLRYLCAKNNLTWPGTGSISTYNDAIASERKKNREIYSKTDGKSVTSWGGMRNDAAHNPTDFDRSRDSVLLMIEGIRQFISRTT
jgi:hypothetical protein